MMRNRKTGRVFKLDPFLVGVAIAVVMIVGFFVFLAQQLFSPDARPARVHRAEVQCHQRGPQYHYWEDRGECVLYIQEGP